MRSSLVAILLAFTVTAVGAAERVQLTAAVPPAVAQAADVVKTSLGRAPAVAAPSHAKASPAEPTQAPATDDAPPEVSLEMVLAALALMIVITMRRYRSGPR